MVFFIKKTEAHKSSEHDVSQFTEYPFNWEQFSTGVSEIHGRYPEHGFDVDTEVTASWYVASGEGQICLDEQTFTVSAGDMLYVPQNTKFWIEGEALKLVVTSSPPWTPEQHKHLDV